MTLGARIAALRKQHNITQEALAQKLGVTNQAVSKWESDQCCPDVTLLPKIADIFEISLDALFGRASAEARSPFSEDDTLRIVLFRGNHRLIDQEIAKEITIDWQGDVLNLRSDFAVNCGDVDGYVQAGGSVNCGDVEGSVNAGGNVNCGDVQSDIQAGGNVSCGDIEGSLIAGGKVTCGDISGDVTMGRKSHSDEDSHIFSGKDMAGMWKDMFPWKDAFPQED